MAENQNGAKAQEETTSATNTGAPVSTKKTDVLSETENENVVREIAKKANAPARKSFTAQFLGSNETKDGSFALEFGMPNGDVKTLFVNGKYWETLQDRFKPDNFVRVSVEVSEAGKTTYTDVESGNEYYHTKSNERFASMSRSTEANYNREVPINQGDLDIIGSAADAGYAGAFASYLGAIRR